MVKFEGIELEVATLEQAAFEMILVPKRQSYEEASCRSWSRLLRCALR